MLVIHHQGRQISPAAGVQHCPINSTNTHKRRQAETIHYKTGLQSMNASLFSAFFSLQLFGRKQN